MDKYMISDAARMVNVESHVLRYWEEELGLEVHRNQLGHRYYTSEDIELFKNINELKRSGIGLKAIRTIIPNIKKGKKIEDIIKETAKETLYEVDKTYEKDDVANDSAQLMSQTNANVYSYDKKADSNDKMVQFQNFLKEAVADALLENGKSLGKEVSVEVSEKVIKEMDYMNKVQDERAEERYKRLDEVIRSYQRIRQETAADLHKEKSKKSIWRKKIK